MDSPIQTDTIRWDYQLTSYIKAAFIAKNMDQDKTASLEAVSGNQYAYLHIFKKKKKQLKLIW